MSRVGAVVASGLLAAFGAAVGLAPRQAYASRPPWAPTAGRFPAPCLHPSAISPIPAADVSTLEKDVTSFVGPSFAGIGSCGNGLMVLTLLPGSEAVAKKVRATFGPSVQIMVGLTVWNGRPGRSPRCGNLPSGAGPPPGFTATLHLDSRTVVSGSDLHGSVVFKDRSGRRAQLDSAGPILVELIEPGTHRVVGTDAGAIGGTGEGGAIAPGATYPIPVVGGTARCDGGIGSALPPGHYTAVGLVGGAGVSVPDNSGPTYVSSVVPVEVVAR
jgi:hypothetical protein